MRLINKPDHMGFVTSQSAYFPTLYALNFLPTRYMHDAWIPKIKSLKSLGEDGFKLAASVPRSETRINHEVLKHFKLEGSLITDLNSFQKRFILIPSEDILDVIPYIGAVVHAHWILKVLSGSEIKAIKAAIGEPLYDFLTKKITFMFNWAKEENTFANNFPKDPKKLKDTIFATGVHVLYRWFHAEDISAVKRLEIKLPPKYAQSKYGTEDQIKYLTDFNQTRLDLLFRKMIKERHPQWAQLFS